MEALQPETLRNAYLKLLAKRGLDLAFRDAAPAAWPEIFSGDSFNPRAAQQAIRVLENDRRYLSFNSVGTEPEADYLYRLGTVGAVGGPYQGEGLARLQQVLDSEMSELWQWLEMTGVRLPYPVFAGVFPTGEFNARAFPVPGLGALVLLISGLMDLTFTVLKANLASSFGPGDPPLLDEDQVTKVLAEAFNAYLYSESSIRSMGLPSLPDARNKPLGFVLRRSEQFVVAHELGHVSLGHVPIDATTQPAHTRDQERDADLFAVQMLAAALEAPPGPIQDDEATFLAGAIMTFVDLARAINWLQRELGIEQRDSKTHPETDERAESLGAFIEAVLPGATPLRRATTFSNWISHYLPAIQTTIKRVDETVNRPPFVRSW